MFLNLGRGGGGGGEGNPQFFTRQVPGLTITVCNKITVHVALAVNTPLITKTFILSHSFSIPLQIPGRKAIFSRLYHFLQLCLATFLSFEHR